jgi:glycosyltransferase involved in cell wall biosynthesis
MQETCVTVTLMKFLYRVYLLTGDTRYVDAFEISFYNAYLGAINTEKVIDPSILAEHPDWMVEPLPFDSYSPLTAGTRGKKIGGLQLMSDMHYYGCCACIGSAGLGLVPQIQLCSADDGVALNLFIDGIANAKTPQGRQLELITVTDYPRSANVALRLNLEASERFALRIRDPYWSKTTTVTMNGRSIGKKVGGYIEIDHEWNSGDELELVLDMSFNLSWRHTGASVYKIVHNKVTYYFVENHSYFERGRLYGEFDDAERFAFFSRAVVEFMLHSGNIPDVLHANDWQTAPAIILLKTEYAHIEALRGVKTVYTIHNIEYQGKFGLETLGDVFGIGHQHQGVVEYDGCLNLMKGAIVSSDYVTTVSPNYAHELEHEFFAFGLSGIIKDAKHKMRGVINGIDYGYFSPEKGGDIYASYNNRTYKSGKAKNKAALQAEVGLPVEADIPLVVMITRFASQKGIDLVLHP